MLIEIRHIDSVMNVDIRVAMAISLTVIILRWDHVHFFWFFKSRCCCNGPMTRAARIVAALQPGCEEMERE